MLFAKKKTDEERTTCILNVHEIDSELMKNKIVDAILSGQCEKAREYLKVYLEQNMEDPEIYNLLALSYEKEGNLNKAAKYFRVSYFMDQTFLPAKNNLNRVEEFVYKGFDNIDWGIRSKKL